MAIFKRPYLIDSVNKMKLWPSKRGLLHGVREVENLGALIRLTTYCGVVIVAKSSRRSRVARWLRNRWMNTTCIACAIPDWKTQRFRESIP